MKKVVKSLFVLLLIIFIVILGGIASNADTLYDSYTVGYNGGYVIYDKNWSAQTFTASDNYTITNVSLEMSAGISGTYTVTVGIYNTDVDGHPTGTELGNYTRSDISALNWYNFTISPEVSVTSGNKYAIVVRCPDATGGTDYVTWKVNTTGTYAGGNGEGSSDGGATWSSSVGDDTMFEVWGNPISYDTVYVDDDAPAGWYDATHVHTIQEGINNVSDGGTVYVWNGTYS